VNIWAWVARPSKNPKRKGEPVRELIQVPEDAVPPGAGFDSRHEAKQHGSREAFAKPKWALDPSAVGAATYRPETVLPVAPADLKARVHDCIQSVREPLPRVKSTKLAAPLNEAEVRDALVIADAMAADVVAKCDAINDRIADFNDNLRRQSVRVVSTWVSMAATTVLLLPV